jgi:hypothetical protein
MLRFVGGEGFPVIRRKRQRYCAMYLHRRQASASVAAMRRYQAVEIANAVNSNQRELKLSRRVAARGGLLKTSEMKYNEQRILECVNKAK